LFKPRAATLTENLRKQLHADEAVRNCTMNRLVYLDRQLAIAQEQQAAIQRELARRQHG
jgi:hypothetical protein